MNEMSSTPINKSGMSRGLLALIIGGCLLVVVLLFGTLSMVVYGYDGRPVGQTLARVFPFPAALVNMRPVSYDKFMQESKLTQRFYEYNKSTGNDTFPVPLRSQVLDTLIQKELIMQYAKKHDLKVTDEEIDAYFQQLAESAGMNEQQAKEFITTSFGADLSVYRHQVIVPDIYRSEVLAELQKNDQDYLAPTKQKADEVFATLEKGEKSFEDVAKESSQDSLSAEKGGDIDYFPESAVPEEVRSEVTALEVGKYSRVLYTPGSYVIIKMEGKVAKDEKYKDADGNEQTASEPTYHLKGIFFFTAPLDEWLAERVKAAKVYRFVKNPDAEVNVLLDADRVAADAAAKDTGTQTGDVIDANAAAEIEAASDENTEDGADASAEEAVNSNQ